MLACARAYLSNRSCRSSFAIFLAVALLSGCGGGGGGGSGSGSPQTPPPGGSAPPPSQPPSQPPTQPPTQPPPSSDVAPTISFQSYDDGRTEGETATFAVTASGTEPLNYQWQRNGTPIAGATASTYTTDPLTVADSGAVFSVLVTNIVGQVSGVLHTLTVYPRIIAPTLTSQLTNQQVALGSTVTFSVSVTGSAPLTRLEFGRIGAELDRQRGRAAAAAAIDRADHRSYCAKLSNDARLAVPAGRGTTGTRDRLRRGHGVFVCVRG
jgi:hypothetical protein